MNHFAKYFILLLLLILSITGFGQDTLRVTFKDFRDIQNKSGVYRIDDIYQNFYKLSVWNARQTEYLIKGENVFKLDTSIYLDYSFHKGFPHLKNDSLLLQYYSENIYSPPHGGDPNHAIVSFVVDEAGKLKSVRVLEDVKNRLCDGEWEIIMDRDYGFEPFILNGQAYMTEYIIRIKDIGYCVPLTEKGNQIKR